MTKIPGWLLVFTLANQAQNARPDFTGIWRLVGITLGPVTNSMTEIKQSEFTFLLRAVLPGGTRMKWDEVYSTDGKVMTTKIGRQRIERSAHWDGNQLVLLDTGPGNAPWRRNTEQRILSLSEDGHRMTMRVHNLSDKRSVHDYAMEWEQVRQ